MNKKAMVVIVISAIIMSPLIVVTAVEANSTPQQSTAKGSPQQAIGVWEFKSDWPKTMSMDKMTITKNKEGKYEGTWSAEWGESKLSDVTLENGKIRFLQISDFDGQETKTVYEGTVADGKMAGKAQEKWGEFTFEGTLGGETKGDITGEWQMKITIPAGVTNAKMTITSKADGTLAGKWKSRRGKNMISDVKCEGGKLTFTHVGIFMDREVVTKFAGTIEGDNIKGVFSSERGDIEASATLIKPLKTEKKPVDAKKAEPNKQAAGKKN